MNVQPIIKNFIGAEVFINSVNVGHEPKFENLAVINKGARLTGIVAFTATQLAVTPSGRPVVPAAGAPSIVVSFFDKNEEVIKEIPYIQMVSSSNGGLVRLTNIVPNFTKCKIKLVSATGLTVGQSAYFGLIYEKV